MQRINSARINASASPFDPLGLARGAAIGEEIIAPIADGMAAKADAMARVEERQATLFAAVETSRMEREIATDLDGVRQTMPETGAGYAKMAADTEEKRFQEAMARAGGDPIKKRKLEERHALDREQRRASFEEGERNFGRAYALNQHALSFDNAQQEIGRAPAGVSKYDPTGVSASAAGALAELERSAGRSFNVKSAYRDPGHNAAVGGAKKSQHTHGNAFDIDARDMSKEERAALIVKARAAGFGGVGVYENSLHFDVGPTRHWGPDYHAGSLPDWAAAAVGAERGAAPAGLDHNGLPLHVGEVPDVWANPVVASHRDDLHGQIDALPITKAEKEDLKRQVDGGLTMSALQRMGQENPAAALAALRSGAYDDVVSYADDLKMQGGWSKILETQITDTAKAELGQMKAAAQTLAADNVAWQMAGRKGEAPPSLAPEQIGLLTDAQQANYLEAVDLGGVAATARNVDLFAADAYLAELKPAGEGFAGEAAKYEVAAKVIAERRDAAAVESHVGAALGAGVAPDMSLPGVKTEVDKLFDAALVGADDPLMAAGEFAASRRVAPERFGGMVAQAMSSSDPAVAMRAVEMVARVNAVDPRILADASNGAAIDRAAAVGAYVDLGVSPKDAFEFTRAMVDPSRKAEIKARADLWSADKGAIEDQAHEAFVGRLAKRGEALGLGSGDASAAIPASVWGEYADLVKERYSVTGNVEVSVAAAERAFYASHAVTRVGGVPQWQKDAPEAHYRVWGDERDSAWVEDQAVMFAKLSLGQEVASVTLQPLPSARRMAKPGYSAIAVLADGSAVPVPEVFTPNPEPEQPKQAVAAKEDTRRRDASVEVQGLMVKQIVAYRKLQDLKPGGDPKAYGALLQEWRSYTPLIREARQKRDALEANAAAKNQGESVNLFGALPAIAP